jgi:D-tyrosyl-tRNA(Tyr) deacylase
MLAVIQRVKEAKVFIDNKEYSRIGEGAVVFLSVKKEDSEENAHKLAKKIAQLRIFPDEGNEWQLSLLETKGEIMVISQFTLYASIKKGRRPDFSQVAKRDLALTLYLEFIKSLKEILGEDKIKNGIFGALMQINLTNWGPVTLIVED